MAQGWKRHTTPEGAVWWIRGVAEIRKETVRVDNYGRKETRYTVFYKGVFAESHQSLSAATRVAEAHYLE